MHFDTSIVVGLESFFSGTLVMKLQDSMHALDFDTAHASSKQVTKSSQASLQSY